MALMKGARTTFVYGSDLDASVLLLATFLLRACVNVYSVRFLLRLLTRFLSHGNCCWSNTVTFLLGAILPLTWHFSDLNFIGIQSMSEMRLLQLLGPWWAGGEMTGWKWVVKTTTAKRLMQLIFHYVQWLWIVISLDCSSSEAQIKCKWFLNGRKCSLWDTVQFRAEKMAWNKWGLWRMFYEST